MSVIDRVSEFFDREGTLERREKAVATREIESTRLETELRSEREDIESQWAIYDQANEAMKRTWKNACAFIERFKDIPEDQRTPKVAKAFDAATQMENDQVLSAYLNGKKGRGVAE